MSDGDIDFNRYSVEQLLGILKRIDRDRYPLNYQNARAALRAQWPEAPEDLSTASAVLAPVAREPMRTLPDGTRRFAVNFAPPRPAGPGELAPNDQKLGGSGWLDVSATEVRFAEVRDGQVYRERRFALADVANVEWSEVEGVVVIRSAIDDRHVAVWLHVPEEAVILKDLLPVLVTPQFKAQRQHEADFSQRLLAVAPRAYVVPALIALNVIVFVIMAAAGAGIVVSDPQVHVAFGSNYGPLTWTGEPWRLLTSAFLHFGVIHIAFNMYALHNGGMLTERLYGSGRFLVIYLLAALAGSVASGWWDSSRNSAGASGAVFGVYGALLAFFAVRRADIPARLLKTAGKGALVLLGYSLAIGVANPLIDNACHVGGLVGGAVAGLLLARPFQTEARATKRPMYVAIVAAGICATLALFSASLWSSGGGRHAGVIAEGEIRKFGEVEEKVVKKFVEIVSAMEKHQITAREAGLQIERDVLPRWRGAMQPLLAVDAAKLSDEKRAGTLRTLQRYVKHRDDAMHLTATLLKRGQMKTTPELDQAWAAVRRELAALSAEE